MRNGLVLLVPAWETGRGGGHLTRCLALLRGLGGAGRLFLPAGAADAGKRCAAENGDASRFVTEDALPGKTWTCIVLDRFQTPPEEFARWARLAPVIGIDEGGPRRDDFDFLIDILPGLYRSKPNIAAPSLLPPAETIPASGIKKTGPCKILISFGREDAAGLGLAAAEALSAGNGAGDVDITLLTGGMGRSVAADTVPAGVRVLESIPGLGGRLAEYGLLITHYGITAFEALYAGVPAVLVSPGAYHEKLAKAAGFFSAGTGKSAARKLPRLLFTPNGRNDDFITALEKRRAVLAVRHGLDRPPGQNLAALLGGFSPGAGRNCPVCGGTAGGKARRCGERTYRRCPICGVIRMSRLTSPPVEYGREYFFELYQKQYGKTYLEDFPGITVMAKRRLGIIKTLLPANPGCAGRALLDIGCAYGPFLAAAREAGFYPAGIDPAEDAVRYVTQTLGIQARRGFFPEDPVPKPPGGTPGGGDYDVVTLWYVIEHFRDCVPVLAGIRRILKAGGVLAFSTPSFSGISGRSSPEKFLSQSPADHWTIWSPGMCKKALAPAGFRVKKIVVSGHHPERFPLLGKFAQSKKSPLYGPLLAVSRIFRLGDTFEVYAVLEEPSCKKGCSF